MMNVLTPVNDIFRKDFEVADTTLLDPTVSNAFEQGEWVAFNATGGKAQRVGASSLAAAAQIFSEKGDYAVQALGKLATLFLHEYEAETDMFADAGGGFALYGKLTVKNITVDGVTRTGFTQAVQGTDFVYAIVTKLPADNGGLIRYKTLSPYFWATN